MAQKTHTITDEVPFSNFEKNPTVRSDQGQDKENSGHFAPSKSPKKSHIHGAFCRGVKKRPIRKEPL